MSEVFFGAKMLRELQAELKEEYHLGAFKWADAKLDGAHSKAVERFSKAIEKAQERMDYKLLEIEGDYYKQSILEMFRAYKKAKGIRDAENFLAALRVS